MINDVNIGRLKISRVILGLSFSLLAVLATSILQSSSPPITNITNENHQLVYSPADIIPPDTIKRLTQDKLELNLQEQMERPDYPATYPGGDEARMKFISSNITYPEDARKAGIEGRVYVQFIIDESGKVTQPKVLKKVYPSLDKIALETISKMPDWKPAIKNGKPISFEMTIPIAFNLEVYRHFKDTVPNSTDSEVTYSKSTIKPQKKEGSNVFTVVEVPPEYPGGDEARSAFISSNIKYPLEAKKQGIEGTVYITFVVEPDGSITGAKVLRGVGGGLDEVALDVVKKMPKWTPGKVEGEPVPVQFNMPIKFKLTDSKEEKSK